MAKILVTGTAGFIGSHLSERLLDLGYDVWGIDNFDPFYDRATKEENLSMCMKSAHFHFLEMDITDRSAFSDLPTNFDLVIHLAAKAGVRPSIAAPDDYLKTNIEGSQNILNWMAANKMKNFLFAGSSSVYGNNTKIPFSEIDNVDNPISPYAYTKKACELMIHCYHHLYDFNTIILRFFTVYGPRQRPDLAIHKFTRMIRKGETITMYGDGSTARDYTYISDIVNGVVRSADLLMQSPAAMYEIINLGNHSPVSLKDLIAALFKAAGKDVPVRQMPMQPGDVDITYADIEKAGRLLGYHPGTNLADGLKSFIDWYDARN